VPPGTRDPHPASPCSISELDYHRRPHTIETLAMTEFSPIHVRPATAEDAPVLHEMVVELAAHEQMSHLCESTPDSMREALTSEDQALRGVVAEIDGIAAGMATFFGSYSTFFARRGIYVEDIYVRPAFRYQGVGRALMRELCRYAVEHGTGRLEWTTLLWNTSAIDFFDSIGAQPSDVWTTYRLSGEFVQRLAGSGDPAADADAEADAD
jgi:GNAT superfamily N-acetyltransferase